uniref:HAT C-terminal dimerisation domain-containing protein n=1 Tax=Acrobeloides nanus TaxID=290746 RepID=A0A914BVI8_9BILA
MSDQSEEESMDLEEFAEELEEEENSEESNDKESDDSEQHKVYKGHLTNPQKIRILDMFLDGTLRKGNDVMAGFVQLVYNDAPDISAASICKECSVVLGESHSVRSSLYSHQKAHQKQEPVDIKVPGIIKLKLTSLLADMVSMDILPFYSVKKEGLRKILVENFKEGYNFGRMISTNFEVPPPSPDISDLIPNDDTVKKFVDDYVALYQPKFNAYVKRNMEMYGAGITMDFCQKSSEYFISTVHFLTADWTFQHGVLDFHEYEEECSRGVDILRDFQESMQEHGLNENTLSARIMYNTDRGTNLLNALSNYQRFDDPCHQLNILCFRLTKPYSNNYLPAQFALDEEVKDKLRDIDRTISYCLNIINGVTSRKKLRKRVKKLGPALVKPTEIRWLTSYYSVISFLNLNQNQLKYIYNALKNIPVYKEALTNVYGNRETLEKYVEVVEPISKVIKILEQENMPTFNLVALKFHWLQEIYGKLKNSENKIECILALSASKIIEYQKSLPTTVSEHHFIGLLCDPLLKDEAAKLEFWTTPQEVKQLFKKYVEKYNKPIINDRYEISPDSPFSEACRNQPDILENEINEYLGRSSSAYAATYTDCLHFWRSQEEHFKHIAVLARRLLPIVSSAASERIGSTLSKELAKQRLRLNSNTVTSLILMKNLKKFQDVVN